MRPIELAHISKRFGDVAALADVSLSIPSGRVVGLLGENGAGKSTLMNVLYGLVRPDAGEIRIDGSPVTIRSPKDALALGVGMVHQHFMLAGGMIVLDNVLLGDRRQGQWLDRRSAARTLSDLSRRLELNVDPYARVEEQSVGQQQRVEIVKALYRDARVLILDEPTAVLTPQESEQLLAAMRRLRDEGRSVVFISHKLGEVLRACDDVVVMRRGRVEWSGPARGVTPEELARHMVGRDVAEVRADTKSDPTTPPVIRLDGITAQGITDITLPVGAEMVGIAGVDGNGQQELAEVIVGLRHVASGRLWLGDEDITHLDVARRTRLGVAHIPNDRRHEGLVPSMTVAENVALKQHGRPPFSRGVGVVSWKRTRVVARDLASAFDVRAASVDVPVGALSGGNQQKVLLARELALVRPRVVVAMNPARGLDVAATNFVYEQLLKCRRDGCAVVLISSDLDELLRLCDRIAVLYRGRLTMTDFPRAGVRQIGRLMAGVADA
jgi:general nucleoside transport system ATP-binding protein